MLNGKVAVVTGSAQGIGRGICLALANAGAKIAAIDIDIHGNHQTLRSIKESGGECITLPCDIGNRDDVRGAFSRIMEEFERIDILINNAAVWDNSSLLTGTFDSQTADFNRAINAGALGTFNCCAAAAPVMRNFGGGNIINLITEHVIEGHFLSGRKGHGYDCAKFAQWRLTSVLASELSNHGIRVNGMCFGATDTPMLRGEAPSLADQAMKPQDVAQAVINIIAHGAGGPTGQVYVFGTSGTPRAQSLEEIAKFAPR